MPAGLPRCGRCSVGDFPDIFAGPVNQLGKTPRERPALKNRGAFKNSPISALFFTVRRMMPFAGECRPGKSRRKC
jgi:hypothetical protein